MKRTKKRKLWLDKVRGKIFDPKCKAVVILFHWQEDDGLVRCGQIGSADVEWMKTVSREELESFHTMFFRSADIHTGNLVKEILSCQEYAKKGGV